MLIIVFLLLLFYPLNSFISKYFTHVHNSRQHTVIKLYSASVLPKIDHTSPSPKAKIIRQFDILNDNNDQNSIFATCSMVQLTNGNVPRPYLPVVLSIDSVDGDDFTSNFDKIINIDNFKYI